MIFKKKNIMIIAGIAMFAIAVFAQVKHGPV